MEVTLKFLQKSFNMFNKSMFDGTLPPLCLKLSHSKRMLGAYECKRIILNGENTESTCHVLKLSDQFLLTRKVLEDAIIHEMIHYYVELFGKENSVAHGPLFLKKMNEINEKFNRNIVVKLTLPKSKIKLKKRPHYQVVAAVIENEGEFLCMQKGKTRFEYTSFKWEFPGGKVEKEETPEKALQRELIEEMNYEVVVGSHLVTVKHEYPDFIITMAAYHCHALTREFEMKEHNAYKWLVLDEMKNLDWCAADIPIMKLVIEKI